ncbi:MAG: aspartate aminotransferase family protein [Sphingobacteriales bacterium 50-39]|nr:aspartate aminotransferase family protein [Sphingobacteriales bacterium]OJW58502.1 MAG: aspartate aminotransferase family protein [Sphingobacteriales bacterium 50-39]
MPIPTYPEAPRLLTVDDAYQLGLAKVTDLFRTYLNPGQYQILQLLGFNEVLIDHAEGMYYFDASGRGILDFFGGFGSLALGHNHPRILAARKHFEEHKRHDIALSFMSQYAGALAKNLATIAPGDLDMVYLCSSGSEAVEAALKLAEKVQGPGKNTIAYGSQSFHGKTRGALSVTDSSLYQSTFSLISNRTCVPFGDAPALEEKLQHDATIGIVILETIQGGAGIIVPPEGYLLEVRKLCDRYNVLLILDEVQCGVGRTGRFFAFEHEQVTPDIVTLAKSLGGGKAAIGAMISRRPLFMSAYGTQKTFLTGGTSTFGGIGETCITAIEALNVLYDENLLENCRVMGQYLLTGLEALQKKYPVLIKEVRGRGLMIGIEFHNISKSLPLGLRHMVATLDHRLKGSICGFIGKALLKDFNILVAFTEYNRNVMRLEPPLIVTRQQIDTFLQALDSILHRGVFNMITKFALTMAKTKILPPRS